MLGHLLTIGKNIKNCLMFTISTHDNNIKHADSVIIIYYVYQNRFFCSFYWFWLAIIISISKMLVKKSTDLKLNLPLSRRLSLLWRSFSCGIGQLIFVASPLFFIFFVTFFFFFIRRCPACFLSDKCSTHSTR